MTTVQLTEWTVLKPTAGSALAGHSFDAQPAARTLAQQLTATGRLTIYELRNGLELHSNSFVGSLALGDLHLVITPKLDFDVLKVLFRYAYRLRDLQLFEATHQFRGATTFQDLLIQQLAAESENLLAHGLHRQYLSQNEQLASPRGRIDLQQIVRAGGVVEAQIPCWHYPRTEDNVLNTTVLAGLGFAASLTSDLVLRTHLRRLASRFAENMTQTKLNSLLLDQANQALNRLTTAYAPALRLISLLYAGTGLDWSEEQERQVSLPGFLFDMNDFFEALVTRFLKEHLPDYQVQAQHHLREMVAYHPAYNPRKRHAPTPRPDIALMQNGAVVALLDTKYRDLWEQPLPRDMLYQLAIYALSQTKTRAATILYPVTTHGAQLQVIEIRDPIWSGNYARVILRPLHLPTLAHLLAQPGAISEQARIEYAKQLVGDVK